MSSFVYFFLSFNADILKKTTTEMMQRSLSLNPVPPPAVPAAKDQNVGMLDALMASIPDSVVDAEHSAAMATTHDAASDSATAAQSSNSSLSNEDADHLPEAPAVPSLRMRLYLSGSSEDRSSLCHFLETTESLASNSKEPPAKRFCL